MSLRILKDIVQDHDNVVMYTEEKIYIEGRIPDEWKIAEIIPLEEPKARKKRKSKFKDVTKP